MVILDVKYPIIYCHKKPILIIKLQEDLKERGGWKEHIPCLQLPNKIRVAILIPEKVDFKNKDFYKE